MSTNKNNNLDKYKEKFFNFHFKDSKLKINGKEIVINTKEKLITGWSLFALLLIIFIAVSVSGVHTQKNTSKKSTNEASTEAEITLDANKYPEINDLIANYFNARIACDTETLKSIVSDPTEFDNDAALKAEASVVENYQNYTVYTTELSDGNGYFILVAYDAKMIGADTLAPGIKKFYVYSDENEQLKINNSSVLDDAITSEINACLESADTQSLIRGVSEAYTQALQSDSNLKAIVDSMQANQ